MHPRPAPLRLIVKQLGDTLMQVIYLALDFAPLHKRRSTVPW